MAGESRDEIIGRIYRQRAEDRKAIAFIDAELSDAANAFRTAATQIECLISQQASDAGPALARIHMDRILRRVAERERLQRRLADAEEQLKRLLARK